MMNPLNRTALRLLGLVDLTKLDMPIARLARRWLCRTPKSIQQLATHPDWIARWTAVLGAERTLQPDMAWALALHLATDAEAVVRQASARTICSLWHGDPDRRITLEEFIVSRTTPSTLTETILDACSDLWRRHPERLDEALFLLTLAGRQPPHGALLTIGSVRVGIELERSHPEVAQSLRDEWAHAASPHLRYHAAWAGGSGALDATALSGLVDPAAPLPEGWRSTADVPLGADVGTGDAVAASPYLLGREEVQLALRVAALQGRTVVLTGSSADVRLELARIAAALRPGGTEDLVALPNPRDTIHPLLRRAAGGTTSVGFEHVRARRTRRLVRSRLAWWLASGISAATAVIAGIVVALGSGGITVPVVAAAVLGLLLLLHRPLTTARPLVEPRVLVTGSVIANAPFIDGTRLSPAELFGEIRERAMEAAAHDRLVPGAIHRAHRGVLYFESPTSLSPKLQRELLAAMQSGQASIRGHESSWSVVESQPVPCDVLLVLGADADPSAQLDPAFAAWLERHADRVAVPDELADSPRSRRQLAQFMATVVRTSDGVPHLARSAVEFLCDDAAKRASAPGRLALDAACLRTRIEQAGARARSEGSTFVQVEHVAEDVGETAAV